MIDNTPYLLALNAHPKIGSQTAKKVLTAFPDLSVLWSCSATKVSASLESKLLTPVLETIRDIDPEKEMAKLGRLDVGYITMYDKLYPKLLQEIYDGPVVLYIRGDAGCLGEPSIAVVGSRKCTYYGRRVAKSFSKDIVGAGAVVVSGLALGIDGEAHLGALDGVGKTVGVLGCGIDQIYPVCHNQLAKKMIESGGAVISEFPPGTPAFKQNFPSRNRIIAGISLGTVVIEATEDSGSLITALCALEYNREVFAVPGNIDQLNSTGTNRLIQRGAKLVLGVEDILSEVQISAKKSHSQAKKILPATDEENTILQLLHSEPCFVDEIVSGSGLNIIAVNTTLTMLEMKGIIENTGGGRYRKIC